MYWLLNSEILAQGQTEELAYESFLFAVFNKAKRAKAKEKIRTVY